MSYDSKCYDLAREFLVDLFVHVHDFLFGNCQYNHALGFRAPVERGPDTRHVELCEVYLEGLVGWNLV
jgi:hypothetical protein